MMKKITLSALAAITVAGTAIAGPATVVTSKEYKQPCVTPCFRDTEFQLDLFYSYNDAEHQGDNSATDRHFFGPATTPITGGLVPGGSGAIINDPTLVPAGSTVTGTRRTTIKDTPFFRDGSGGGVGLNYFFWRYVGIGVEGNWWDGVNEGFTGSYNARELVTLPVGVSSSAVASAILGAYPNTKITVVDGSTILLKRSRDFSNTKRSTANQVTGSLILRYPFEGPICWAPYIFGGGGGVFDGDSTGFGHIGLGVEFRVTPYMGFFTDWRWEFMSGDNDNDDWRNDSRVKDLARAVGGFRNLHLNNDNNNRNDVSMTRVGVRFVF